MTPPGKRASSPDPRVGRREEAIWSPEVVMEV
jgi:hypothetical protein